MCTGKTFAMCPPIIEEVSDDTEGTQQQGTSHGNPMECYIHSFPAYVLRLIYRYNNTKRLVHNMTLATLRYVNAIFNALYATPCRLE